MKKLNLIAAFISFMITILIELFIFDFNLVYLCSGDFLISLFFTSLIWSIVFFLISLGIDVFYLRRIGKNKKEFAKVVLNVLEVGMVIWLSENLTKLVFFVIYINNKNKILNYIVEFAFFIVFVSIIDKIKNYFKVKIDKLLGKKKYIYD